MLCEGSLCPLDVSEAQRRGARASLRLLRETVQTPDQKNILKSMWPSQLAGCCSHREGDVFVCETLRRVHVGTDT